MKKLSHRSPFHYGWVVLTVGTLVVAGSLGLARFGYTVVLPSMQAGLGMDNTTAGMLATVNLVGYLALALIGGALASRFGPRTVVAAGLGLAGLSMVLTGLCRSPVTAGAWRAVTGLGSGASNVPVMGLMAAWFAARRRGMAAGVAVTGSSIAIIVVGPLAPRILAEHGDAGWRVCWFVFGGATLLIGLTAWLLLRNRPDDLRLEAIGTEQAGAETAQADPAGIPWGSVYRSRAVWHLGAVYVAFGFSYIIYMVFFIKYLVSEGGYTREAAGQLFMVMGWCSLLCGLIWGTVSDVIGRKWALMLVYVGHTVAFSMFALWPTPAGFTVSAVLFGLSAWSIPAIMAAACGDVLGPKMAPAALGFITLFFGAGQALGPSVAGALADASGSFSPAFLLAAGVALLGAVGAASIRATRNECRVPHSRRLPRETLW